MLPTISSYGDYSSGNYGMNALQVSMDGLTLFYSYQTIVAYRDAQDGLTICENIWGTTTGKHLNWIHPDHSRRVSYNEFREKLADAIERHIH